MTKAFVRLVVIATLFHAASAAAQSPAGARDERPGWYIQGGFYLHYADDEDYEGPPLFAGIEYVHSRKVMFGFSMFQNSFGQFSQYAYAGRLFHPLKNHPDLHFKLTGGIVQGYRGEHHETLPIRWNDSWGIGVIPTIGYRKERFGVDLAFLKASAALFLIGYRFD